MNFDPADLVGYLAATLTTIAFVPQVINSWRSRDLSGISLAMYCILVAGIVLWLAYGIMLWKWPIIIANAITLILASVVLGLKVRHK